MFLLVPAHPGCPGQFPQSRKTVMCVCVIGTIVLASHSPIASLFTYTHTQPFYGCLDYVRDNPGELVPEGTFYHLLFFLVQNEYNSPIIRMDCHPIQTDLCSPPVPSPPFLRRMPFLTQPSQFILAWDWHQICWLAYPVAWLLQAFSSAIFQICCTSQQLLFSIIALFLCCSRHVE